MSLEVPTSPSGHTGLPVAAPNPTHEQKQEDKAAHPAELAE